MEIILKLLEIIPLKKEYWIPILISIIFSGVICGIFYIKMQREKEQALNKKVETLEDNGREINKKHGNLEDRIITLEGQSKDFNEWKNGAEKRIGDYVLAITRNDINSQFNSLKSEQQNQNYFKPFLEMIYENIKKQPEMTYNGDKIIFVQANGKQIENFLENNAAILSSQRH